MVRDIYQHKSKLFVIATMGVVDDAKCVTRLKIQEELAPKSSVEHKFIMKL